MIINRSEHQMTEKETGDFLKKMLKNLNPKDRESLFSCFGTAEREKIEEAKRKRLISC